VLLQNQLGSGRRPSLRGHTILSERALGGFSWT
jgi:hypothetical protein